MVSACGPPVRRSGASVQAHPSRLAGSAGSPFSGGRRSVRKGCIFWRPRLGQLVNIFGFRVAAAPVSLCQPGLSVFVSQACQSCQLDCAAAESGA